MLRHSNRFLPSQLPTYAAWWVHDEYVPTWTEAADWLQHLYEHGSTPHAFTFKVPFDAAGMPLTLRDVTTG